MAQRDAVGEGPVVVYDQGRRLLLPLSQIYFDDEEVKTKKATSAGVMAWLKYLVAQNRLRADDTAKPAPSAAIFTAAKPGSMGNGVMLTITKNAADATKVDILVKETDRYEGLTVATIEETLGNTAGTKAGKRPGLLRVFSVVGGAPDPAEGPATEVAAQPAAGANPAVPTTWKVVGPQPASANASFVLAARGNGIDTGATTVTVSEVDGQAGQPKTFTLEIVWTSTVTAVTAADLGAAGAGSKPAQLAYSVAISPPSGGAYKVPRPGIVQLQGGAEPSPERASTATLFAVA